MEIYQNMRTVNHILLHQLFNKGQSAAFCDEKMLSLPAVNHSSKITFQFRANTDPLISLITDKVSFQNTLSLLRQPKNMF